MFDGHFDLLYSVINFIYFCLLQTFTFEDSFERQEKLPISQFTFQPPTIPRAGPGQSQDQNCIRVSNVSGRDASIRTTTSCIQECELARRWMEVGPEHKLIHSNVRCGRPKCQLNHYTQCLFALCLIFNYLFFYFKQFAHYRLNTKERWKGKEVWVGARAFFHLVAQHTFLKSMR